MSAFGYSQWTGVIQFTTPNQWFDPDYCGNDIQLSSNNKVAERMKSDFDYRTVMGTIPNSSFKVKIVTTDIGDILIGLAPHEGIELEGYNH